MNERISNLLLIFATSIDYMHTIYYNCVLVTVKKMANTGVLPFVRGIDFTKNEFGVSKIINKCVKLSILNNQRIPDNRNMCQKYSIDPKNCERKFR